MKRTVRAPVLVTWIALLMALPRDAAAQSSAQAAVSADVVSGLTLTRARDLVYGVIGMNSGSVTMPVTDARTAELRLMAERNRPVTVQIIAPATLSDGSGNTIPYAWAASYNEGATTPGDPAAAVAFPASGTASIRPRENVGGNLRRAYIWVHGSVTVGTVPTGVYSGTVTLQAAY